MRVIRWAVVAAALLLAPLLGGRSASAATKIALLYTPAVDFVASFIAKDEGIFERNGLDVDFTLASNGASIPPALVAGSAQVGTPTLAVLLQADEQGLDLLVIAGATVAPMPEGAGGILVATGSGIKGPADLVGKKVAVPSYGGTLDVLAKSWVEAGGADYRKVDWVEIPFPRMADGLKSGLVDAVNAVSPFYNRILDAKIGIDIGDPNVIMPPGTMVVEYSATSDWVSHNPEALAAFRASIVEANTYLSNPANAEAVRAIVAKYTKLPPEAAATVRISHNLQPRARPEGVVFWIKALREQGLLKGNPDPASVIAP